MTIDIRAAAARALVRDVSPKTELIVGDSIRGIQALIARGDAPYDFVYLDSYDLRTNPLRSMLHGLGEFMLLPALTRPGSIIAIDDSPGTWEDFARVGVTRGVEFSDIESPMGPLIPGKGTLISQLLDKTPYEVVAHNYQLTLRRTA